VRWLPYRTLVCLIIVAVVWPVTANVREYVDDRLIREGAATARWKRDTITIADPPFSSAGDNSSPRRCPPLSPMPLCEGCDKLTLMPRDHGRHPRVRRHSCAARDAARLPRGGPAFVRVPGGLPDGHQRAGRSGLGAGQGGAPRPCASCLTSACPNAGLIGSSTGRDGGARGPVGGRLGRR
jgi:hypothetical protein